MKPYSHPENYGRTAKIVQRIVQDGAFYQACHARYFEAIKREDKESLSETKYQERLLEKAQADGFEKQWREANNEAKPCLLKKTGVA